VPPHREFAIGSDAAGHSRVEQIALSNMSHIYRFEKKDAIDNILHNFSISDLNYVRKKLQSLSASQLRDKLLSHGLIQQLDSSERPMEYKAQRDATACVLIERGLSPRQGDITGALFIDP
jgi:hypothetical protein